MLRSNRRIPTSLLSICCSLSLSLLPLALSGCGGGDEPATSDTTATDPNSATDNATAAASGGGGAAAATMPGGGGGGQHGGEAGGGGGRPGLVMGGTGGGGGGGQHGEEGGGSGGSGGGGGQHGGSGGGGDDMAMTIRPPGKGGGRGGPPGGGSQYGDETMGGGMAGAMGGGGMGMGMSVGGAGGGFPGNGGGFPGRGGAGRGGPGRRAAPSGPPLPKLPEDVASWKDKDFRNAARMRSPQILEALTKVNDGDKSSSYKVAVMTSVLRALAEEPLVSVAPPKNNQGGRRGRPGGPGQGFGMQGAGGDSSQMGSGYGNAPPGYPGSDAGYPGSGDEEMGENYGNPPGYPGGANGGYPGGNSGEGPGMGESYGNPPPGYPGAGGGGQNRNKQTSAVDSSVDSELLFASVEGWLLSATLGQSIGASGGGAGVGGTAGRLMQGGTGGPSAGGAGPTGTNGNGAGGMGMGLSIGGPGGGGGPGQGAPGGGGFPGQGFGQNRGGRGNQNAATAQAGVETEAVVSAVVKSLMENDSKGAWEIVERMLTGKVPTGLDIDETSDLVVRELLANYGGKDHPSHALLMRTLTDPGSIRQDSPEKLSEQATTIVTNMAVSAFDSMLGSLATREAAPAQTGGQNSGRQFGGGNQFGGNQFGQGGGRPPGAPGLSSGGAGGGSGMGMGMSMGGGEGMGAGLGMGGPGAGMGMGGPGGGFGAGRNQNQPVKPAMDLDIQSMTEEELAKALKFLWSPSFTTQIADRVRTSNPADNVSLFALANALPATAVRQAQYKAMQAHWKDGAQSLLSSGLFDSIARDPGLLVILKGMPRPKGKNTTGGQDATSKESWLQASGHVVNMLKSRLHDLAVKGGQTRINGNTPIKLHTGASPEVVYQLEWPKQARERVDSATPSPTRVHYIRSVANVSSRAVSSMVEHYKNRSRGEKRQLPNGVWFDGSKATPTGGRISLDVIITQGGRSAGGGFGAGLGGPGNGPGGGGAGGSSYTIEIIVVEIPDYRSATTTALNSNK